MATDKPALPAGTPLQKQCARFLNTHGKFLGYHASYLQSVEQRAAEKREDPIEHVFAADEGTYSRQSEYLLKMAAWMRERAEGKPLDNATPEARLDIQTTFTHAMAAVNMIIREHKEHQQHVQEESNPKSLLRRYREEHYIPDDEPLDKDVKREIQEMAASNRAEVADMSREIHRLSDMQAAMQGVRSLAVGQRSRSQSQDGEGGMAR